MSDFHGEGDELDGEEERSQNPSTASTKPQVVAETDEGYELKDSLVEPSGGLYTTRELYDKLQDRSIELRADYQRSDVWNDERRIALIDSILRNFYIPPVIFSVSKEEGGSTIWTCMDGKQRLTSIKRFMDGEIPHRDHITRENLFFKHNPHVKHGAGKKKKLLPQRYRDIFLRKRLFCVQYHSLDFSQEQEIFQRVQLGMPLTFAEILNVNFSPRATLARELVETVFPHDHGIADIRSIPINTSRSKGYQIMVQALCVLSRWDSYDEPGSDIPGLFGNPPQTAWLRQTITRRYAAKMKGKGKAEKTMDEDGDSDGDEEEEYEEVQPVPVTEEFRERVKAAADMLVKMAKDPARAALFAKYSFSSTVSPMAFIGWIILAYHVQQTLSEKQLHNLFLVMRIQLHNAHSGEVKTNSRCGETLMTFIMEALKDPGGLIRKAEDTGLLAWAGMRLTEDGSIVLEASGRPGRKRKRRDEEHEGEDSEQAKRRRGTNGPSTTTATLSPALPMRSGTSQTPSQPPPGPSQPTTAPVPVGSQAAGRRSSPQHGTQSTTPTARTAPIDPPGGPARAAEPRSPSKPPPQPQPQPHSPTAATKSSAPPPPATRPSSSQGHLAGPSLAHTTRQIHQPTPPAPHPTSSSQSKQHVTRPGSDQLPSSSTTPSTSTRHHISPPPPPAPPSVTSRPQVSQLRSNNATATTNSPHQQCLARAFLLWRYEQQLPSDRVEPSKLDELRRQVGSDPVAASAYRYLQQQQPKHIIQANAFANSPLNAESRTVVSRSSQEQQQQQQQQPLLQRGSQPQQFMPQQQYTVNVSSRVPPISSPPSSSHSNDSTRRPGDPYKQPSQLHTSVPLSLQPQPQSMLQHQPSSGITPVSFQVPPSALSPSEEEEDESFIPWTIPDA
ncbi:hypothetical protein Moror_810 [Moniliophthora roreri MCA 2997]|uniref:GmrSD restriction endonucleases N-terminal domain-containing protein n=1 Tax=Moniliophthora roreri (strain MCA 2997) TaxID=1381753 RepID=V2XBL8_MONRO|nr:hypothetical protein Moror_810 [Moniliophthora roreri MCA 2997]